MCDFCGMTHCPPRCPSYNRESVADERCQLCGSALVRGESVLEHQRRYLCAACADELNLDDLLYLTDSPDVRTLLGEHFGWEHFAL